MNLLFKRVQTEGRFGKVWFRLWAKAEFDEDEERIIKRYDFNKAKLIKASQPTLMRDAIAVGLAATVVAWLILQFLPGPFPIEVLLNIVAGIAAGFVFYDNMRETIQVRDLIHGRYFACDSVVALARKEAFLADISAVLRQVMETAKHWHGTETVPIAALSKEEAKYIAIVRDL